MFHQEIDYRKELEYCELFHRLLARDDRYLVPKVYRDYSTRKVLATEFIEGVRADSSEVQALTPERRNRVGLAFLDLYFRELLEFRQVQTDPHLGNYMVQIDPNGAKDRLVLLDFGAVREVPEDFLKSYALLIEGGLANDARMIEKAGRQLGLLQPEDELELVDDYVRLSMMVIEPFSLPEWELAPNNLLSNEDGSYDWGASDLPQRVAGKLTRIAATYRLRAPPRELVFLDRKLGGVFIFMSVLKCRLEARQLLQATLAKYLSKEPR
ncbi:MAG: hypothetical protein HC902_00335 [Calothrix sp. SM1_5_4]|nr:hypothetical protein [Calothrix sp. SM1_5_4]